MISNFGNFSSNFQQKSSSYNPGRMTDKMLTVTHAGTIFSHPWAVLLSTR
jgi:hypothetical protein